MTERQDDNLEADLSAYLDGELSAERAREIEALIASSDEVAGALDELRVVSDELQALPRQRAPSKLMASVTRQLEERPPVDGAGSRRRPRVLRLFGQAAAAAAVLAACVYVSWQALDRPQAVSAVEVVRQLEPSSTDEPVADAEEETADVLVAIEPRKSADVVESAAPLEGFRSSGRGIVQRVHKKGAERVGEPMLSAGVAGELGDEAAADQRLFTIAGNTPSDESGAPAVKVWITPTSVEEYRAASTVLADWQAEGASLEVDEIGDESTYYFATADLSRRIEELDVGAPGRVRVQMSFSAADKGFLELAAGVRRGSVPQHGDAIVAYATVTDENAGVPLEHLGEKSGAPKRERRVKVAPAAPQPQPDQQPADDDGPVDMFDMDALVRRAEAQHRAATAPLPVIVVVPVATQPAADDAPATNQEEPRAGGPMPTVPTLLSSLSRLLLEGPPAPEAPESGEASVSDGVRFQVILVPPPLAPAGATTQPGGG